MLLSAVVTGAAPAWVGTRLTQPQHRATVIHAGSDAVYLRSHDDVIGVLSRHATPVPCAVATRLDSLDGLSGQGRLPLVGDDVTIGSGGIDFEGSQVRVGRYVDFAMPAFDPAEALRMRARLADAAAGLPRPDELSAEVLASLRTRPAGALMRTLGQGSGLTPFGDDVVCAVMATLIAAADPCAAALGEQAVALAPERTTALSATLLGRAAQGDVLPAFAAVVRAIADQPDQAAASTTRLLRTGHTSGAGMLLGLELALEHITTRSCP